MTVQKILYYCEKNGLNPEYTEVNVWGGSSLLYIPATSISLECYGICLDCD